MRVTQSMLSNNMLRHLMNSQGKMDKYLEQLYTGKKIRRPSDDPVIAMKGMNYRSQVVEVEQFKRNTAEVHNWMDNSEAALNEAIHTMQRMRELAVQASNGTYTEDELRNIREEVEQLREHLIDLANTNVNGKYIFNGTNTTEPPIVLDGTTGEITSYPESTTPVNIQVYSGITIPANVPGEDVFNQELFENIDRLIGHLDSDPDADEPIEIGNSLEELDTSIDQLINARADLGARMNRLELIENRLDQQEIIATRTMSENEDVHFEEAITNLITQESLHRAALSAGARIIQPTLIDFLR